MKKSIICLLLACALLLPSCVTPREKDPNAAADTLDLSFLLPFLVGKPNLGEDTSFGFDEKDDGSLSVSHLDREKSLTIPESLNGKPVTSIDPYALRGHRGLEEIILPSALTEISESLFEDCPNLKYNLYRGIKYLGTESNPYEYLICPEDKKAEVYYIHPDTRVIGESAFSGAAMSTIDIPDKVEYINSKAFASCEKLSSVSLPESLKGIGEAAFNYCPCLESVALPESVTRIENNTFVQCIMLSEIKFGSKLEYIGEEAFMNCENLEKLELPESLKYIGKKAFDRCDMLTEVSLPDGIESLFGDSFPENIKATEYNNCRYLGNENNPYLCLISLVYDIGKQVIYNISIHADTEVIAYTALSDTPDTVTSLTIPEASNRFTASGNCIIEKESGRVLFALKNASIPRDRSINTIGAYAFYGSNIKTINIPSNITVIEEHAFENCDYMTLIQISDGLTEIGDYAFYHSNVLRYVYLPKTLTRIGARAFELTIIQSVNLPEGLTEMGERCFASSRLTSLIIPESLKDIPNYAFYHCPLEKIDLGNVQSIGDHAFERARFTSLELPEGLTKIGADAFRSCSSVLTSVNIPESVTSIGSGAFSSCSSLLDIKLPQGLRFMGEGVFMSCSNLSMISIPAVSKYLAENEFTNCHMLNTLILHNDIGYIGAEAFVNCESLKTVYFIGTRAEWEAIEKDTYWTLGCPEFTIKFTDGEVTIPANAISNYIN